MQIFCGPVSPFLRMCPIEIHNEKTQVYCSLTCKSRKSKITYTLLTAAWLCTLWYALTMKQYTIEKNKEVLYVFKGTDLQDRLLGEKSKTQIGVPDHFQKASPEKFHTAEMTYEPHGQDQVNIHKKRGIYQVRDIRACMTILPPIPHDLSKLLNPHFLHLQNRGNNSILLIGVLLGLNYAHPGIRGSRLTICFILKTQC